MPVMYGFGGQVIFPVYTPSGIEPDGFICYIITKDNKGFEVKTPIKFKVDDDGIIDFEYDFETLTMFAMKKGLKDAEVCKETY